MIRALTLLVLFLIFVLQISSTIHNLPLGNPAFCWDIRVIQEGLIYSSAPDIFLQWPELIKAVSQCKIILAGESHLNLRHHELQAKLIEDLVQAGKKVIIGMEFLDRGQSYLPTSHDKSQALPNAQHSLAFFEQTDWFNKVGYSYRYYQPIVEMSQRYGIPMYGLNIPRAVVHQVAQSGLQSLKPQDRALFGEVKTDYIQHRYLIQRIFGKSSISNPAIFERMYEAQCVWDCAMAYSIQQILADLPDDAVLVVIVGSGHVIYDLGIPLRLLEFGISNFTSIVFHELEKEEPDSDPHFKPGKEPLSNPIARNLGHFTIGTPDSSVPAFPNPGCKLSLNAQNQVEITQVSPKGIAAACSWRKQDIVLQLQGQAVTTLAEAQKILTYVAWNDRLSWKIQRGQEILSGETTLTSEK